MPGLARPASARRLSAASPPSPRPGGPARRGWPRRPGASPAPTPAPPRTRRGRLVPPPPAFCSRARGTRAARPADEAQERLLRRPP
eukprot:3974340-Alexandrium_andersonii.AAC.1